MVQKIGLVTSTAAIYVDGANNSLEDINLTGGSGSTNGLLIGDSVPAANNVLFNIRGTGFRYLITISNQQDSSPPTNCPAQVQGGTPVWYNACDISIMGVTNGSSGTTTINDEVGVVTLPDASLGMYILGEPVQWGSTSNSSSTSLGYSHFTTSPNWPTWVVGTNQPSSGCPNKNTGFSNVGSLYSATSGSSGTLWECESSGWLNVK